MRNVFDLFRKYNINTNRVASLELLNENDYDKYEKILEYLNEKELLSSKFIINRLALILDYSDIKKLRTLENILTNNKLDAYSAMYKANSIMFTDDFDNMIDVIDELGSPEYELDYIRILNQSPSLLECSKPSFIKRAINFLKTNNLDHKRICHKTGIFFEPRSLKGMGEVLSIFKKLFGNELGEELIYKSPSVLAKGSASTIKENFDFISSILGKEKTIEYFSDYTSLLYKASNTRMKENYEML